MNSNNGKIGRWALPGFMLASSIALLVVGVPRFLAELMLVPGTPIYESLSFGKPVSDEELKTLEESRLQALRFVDMPKAYTDLGTSYLERARRAETQAGREDFAKQSIEVTTKGLNLAPLNTFAWSRLSSAHIMLGADHYDDAIQAWRTSVATARFEPFLLIQRVHVGIILYGAMDAEDREILGEQFQLTFNWDRRKMLAYAKANQLTEWMIFLAGDDAEAREFFGK